MEEVPAGAAPSWFPAESGAAAAPPAPVASPAPAECTAFAYDLPLLGPAPIPAAEATGLVEDEDAPNETTVGQRVGRARAKPQRLSDSVDAGKSYAPAPPSAGARQWHFNRRMRPKRRHAPPDSPEPVEQWHTTGSDLLGLTLSRPVDEDGSLVNATVISWLPASESDFLDDDGKPAALYKIRYLDGALAGDHEDLEAHEVEESIGESIPMATLPQPAASRVEPRKPPPPDNHPGRLIDPRECPDTVEVNFVATNPKRPGSASYRRYEAYKDATTVKEFLEKGGWRADLVHDVNKNYCALGGAVPTGTPPPPTKPRKYRPPSNTKKDSDDDEDWEKKPEDDDSEDDDFVPSLQEKRAAAAELADGPAFKRRSQGPPAAMPEPDLAPVLQTLGAGMPPAPAPAPPAVTAPEGAAPLGAAVPAPLAPAPPVPAAVPVVQQQMPPVPAQPAVPPAAPYVPPPAAAPSLNQFGGSQFGAGGYQFP